MKTYHKSLLTLALAVGSTAAFAQNVPTHVDSLITQGIALFDKGNLNEAADKYREALKISPNNYTADYELGFTLYRQGKPKEAIPYLETIAKSNNSKFEANNLLGSIYDEDKQPDKAIEYYKEGLKEKPDFYLLHFNLGITYYETKRFAEAEAEAIEAIRLKPDHASSQRLYGMTTYIEGKHINSLLAWCSFLMREPNTPRSQEACNYIKHILYYSKSGNNIAMKSGNDESTTQQQLAIAISATAGLLTVKAQDANATVSPLDSLISPLPSIFKMANETKAKYGPPFFVKYFIDYFGAMTETTYMPVFTHYITASVYRTDDIAWLKAHQDDARGFGEWIKNTKRQTE